MAVTSITVKDGAGANATVFANSDPTTGAAQTVANTNLATIAGAIAANRIGNNPIPGQVGIASGSGINGATVPRTTIATDDTVIGQVTETAPGTDIASSGLNGRLQRVAQNITTLIAKFTLGIGIATGAIRVVLASDSALPAGANILGKLGIDQTTDGTTNLVAAKQNGVWNIGSITTLPALVAGAAIVGKFGIDQTTPGTTNGVQVSAALPGGTNLLGRVKPEGDEYETVAASQTAQILGTTGAAGDYISGILVTPASTSPGALTLLDNAISITLFAGGASSLANLVPFFIPLGMISVSGPWKITTGAGLSCVAIGNFV